MTAKLARDYPERSTAMLRAFGRHLDRASLAGGAAAAISAALVSLIAPRESPGYLVPVISAIVGAVVGLTVARLSIPNGPWRAFQAFSWLGRSEMDRFQARTASKVPIRRPDQEAWLETHPPTPAFRFARIEILAFLGRLDEARAELGDVVATEPGQAFERATLAQYIGWLSDGDPRLAELRAAVTDLPLDADLRRAADVTIAVADARDRFMHADPAWSLPLEAVLPSLGSAPSWVVWRDTWRPMATVYLFVGFVAAAITSLLVALP
jgi:hypothetical protein